MIELIIFVIFILSFAGLLFIFWRKMAVVNSLPSNGTTGIRKHRIILDIENKIKNVFVFFEKQIFMHKFLSWVKIMTLKIETRVDHLLHKLRKKAQEADKKNNDKK